MVFADKVKNADIVFMIIYTWIVFTKKIGLVINHV
jgi:hypothetical protein